MAGIGSYSVIVQVAPSTAGLTTTGVTFDNYFYGAVIRHVNKHKIEAHKICFTCERWN